MLSLFNSYLKIVNFDNIQHSQLLKLTRILLLYVHLLHLKFFYDCWLVIHKEKSEGSIQRVNWYKQGNISKRLIDCSLNTTLIHSHTPNTSKIFTHLTNFSYLALILKESPALCLGSYCPLACHLETDFLLKRDSLASTNSFVDGASFIAIVAANCLG